MLHIFSTIYSLVDTNIESTKISRAWRFKHNLAIFVHIIVVGAPLHVKLHDPCPNLHRSLRKPPFFGDTDRPAQFFAGMARKSPDNFVQGVVRMSGFSGRPS
jgi:hypothetical protein